MALHPIPGPDDCAATWTWHVASRATLDERRAELERCPAEIRDQVRDWVRKLYVEAMEVRR